MNSNFLLLVFVISALTGASNAIVCTENICQLVDCIPNTRESCLANANTLYKPNGGFCGCCALCVHLLAEGESCASTLITGVPPTVQCREGLICNTETLKCSKLTDK